MTSVITRILHLSSNSLRSVSYHTYYCSLSTMNTWKHFILRSIGHITKINDRSLMAICLEFAIHELCWLNRHGPECTIVVTERQFCRRWKCVVEMEFVYDMISSYYFLVNFIIIAYFVSKKFLLTSFKLYLIWFSVSASLSSAICPSIKIEFCTTGFCWIVLVKDGCLTGHIEMTRKCNALYLFNWVSVRIFIGYCVAPFFDWLVGDVETCNRLPYDSYGFEIRRCFFYCVLSDSLVLLHD